MYDYSRKYTPIETVLDIHDTNRYWLYIEGFNGYEMSNDGYLRSMKHFRKYPFGILIKPKIQGDDPVFNISDNNNNRVDIHWSELKEIANHPTRAVSGYPRSTVVTDMSSRNDRHFVKKKSSFQPLDNEPHYAKFTIIDEGAPM